LKESDKKEKDHPEEQILRGRRIKEKEETHDFICSVNIVGSFVDLLPPNDWSSFITSSITQVTDTNFFIKYLSGTQ